MYTQVISTVLLGSDFVTIIPFELEKRYGLTVLHPPHSLDTHPHNSNCSPPVLLETLKNSSTSLGLKHNGLFQGVQRHSEIGGVGFEDGVPYCFQE